jgi:hypothetical protein
VLIAGVPIDSGRTADREEDTVPDPTPTQRAVLVELCRPFVLQPGALTAPPTNAVIALALDLKAERVRKVLSEMYERYDLVGTDGPRMGLVRLAREHGLVDETDYR